MVNFTRVYSREVLLVGCVVQVVAVLGSGDYGRAISKRLVNCGYTVYIGSRDPNRSKIKYVLPYTHW